MSTLRTFLLSNTTWVAAVLVATALVLGGAIEVQSQGAAAPAGNVAKGKALFNDSYGCGSCHGVYGTAGSPRIVPQARSQADFITYVRKPTANGMPAFPDATDQQLSDVYAYLKSIPAPNPPPVQNIPILADILKTLQ
jgi:mono/diheme cytochrome c family protein